MQHSGVVIARSQINDAANAPSRQDVFRMFDSIARRYDLLNTLLSFGQDYRWRKKLAGLLSDNPNLEVLDLATGTADVLLSLRRYRTNVKYGVGLDMAGEMLAIGRHKIAKSKAHDKLALLKADVTSIPATEGSFDVTTMAFGIRNVVDVARALQEMHRVLKSGGKVLILEFSLPSNRFFRKSFLLYLRYLMPVIGGLISGDKAAYQYLNQTIEDFPYGESFVALMKEAGFKNVRAHPLTLGTATVYEGERH